MISMQEVRSKYPQYDDMSDEQFADAFHKKHYSDMPKNQFYEKLGLSQNSNSQPAINNPLPKTEDRSFIDTLANNPVTNTVIGAGDAVNNFLRQTHNLVAPQSMQVPMAKNASGLAYEGGKFLGDFGTLVGGGAGLNAARRAAEAIPYAGKAAEYLGGKGLGGLARRAIGSGAYGAIETPEHRGRGALEGAALSGGLDVIGGGIGKVMPKRYLKEVYKTISTGLGSAKAESKNMYDSVIKPFGQQPISLKGINHDIFEGDSKLKKMWGKFEKNPNIENAHNLQSQIGYTDRKLIGTDKFTNARKDALQSSRENILNSIRKSLGSKYPEARETYDAATKHYRENVVPYDITNKAIRKIVDPTPEKVARKLDAVTKMDKYPKNKSGEDYIPLVPNKISEVGEELSKRVRNRNVAKTIGGFALGGQVGKAFGAPLVGELMGAYLGAKSADPFKKITAGQIESGKLGPLKKLYDNLSGGNLTKNVIKTQALREESPIIDYFTRNKKKSSSKR